MGKKIGRPSKLQSERRKQMISFRLTADEKKALDKAAARAGKKRSEWARKALLSAANVSE